MVDALLTLFSAHDFVLVGSNNHFELLTMGKDGYRSSYCTMS
jgi:hypothetical protein